VQIHHIDGNPQNNSLENLVVLCLDCHSRVTGSRGFGRLFHPGEIRRYKRSWEKAVQESRQTQKIPAGSVVELFPTIDLLICEVLALPPKNSRIDTIFKLLYELQLWRGNDRMLARIIGGFRHLAVMCGLAQEGIAAGKLATTTWQLCWHFVGPDKVPMDSRDAKHVVACIEVLDTLGRFNCEFTSREDVLEEVCKALENFFEVGCWYSDKHIVAAVLKAHRGSVVACKENEEPFTPGLVILAKSLTRLGASLEESGLEWQAVATAVNELRESCAAAATSDNAAPPAPDD
jgi:hypothetical protein